MTGLSRRKAAGIFGAGTFGAVLGGGATWAMADSANDSGPLNPTQVENMARGDREWNLSYAKDAHAADDVLLQVSGYASATSVNVGESIDFHVSVRPAEDYVISVYRLGHYGGEGARKVTQSPTLAGSAQADPSLDASTRMLACNWERSWTLDVPSDLASGLYLAAFTTKSGWRSFAPFVVRDDTAVADFCLIAPFTTYQAYNQWPKDGRTGKSLYNGYDTSVEPPTITSATRASAVSFDRPYHYRGLPSRFEFDRYFIEWVEQQGFNVTYASSVDLHAGRVDPSRYAGLIFIGHDEYWSNAMHEVATKAVAGGTGLAFMEANNAYWHVRLGSAADGRTDRVMTCYKLDPDPAPDAHGPTTMWRKLDRQGAKAEQGLLGVQFNGIPIEPVPLVAKATGHWFWEGTGVRDGDHLDGVVGGETDGVQDGFPNPPGVERVLLSASPFAAKEGGQPIQNTSIYEAPSGAVVFACGSNDWPAILGQPGRRDPRIQRATANVLNRMLAKGSRR